MTGAQHLNDLPITVVVHDHERDLIVGRSGLGAAHADAVRDTIVTAVPAAASVGLVVERSGTPFWGAAAGGDLLSGDRLVEASGRRLPALVGLEGPLRGRIHPLRGTELFHRGGSFGGAVIDDPNVSRSHLRVELLPHLARAFDLGSHNGTIVNGQRVEDSVDLAAGDLVELGTSKLLFVADAPPAPGRLIERGRVFIRPERVDQDAGFVPLPNAIAAAVARRAPVWGLVAGNPHYLTVPGTRRSDGHVQTVALDRRGPVGLVGAPGTVILAVNAWLARLATLHGPARFRVQVDAADDGVLGALAAHARWLPHHAIHPPTRPAWEHRPTLWITEPGAMPSGRISRRDLRVIVTTDRRSLPVGCTAVVAGDQEPPAEQLSTPIFGMLARILAPLSPTRPAEPFAVVEPQPDDEVDESADGEDRSDELS